MSGLFLAVALWYFPGFNSEGLSDADKELLRTSFEADTIECVKWLHKTADWDDAVEMVDNASQVLADGLKVMIPKKREELVLVGHSLGCRVIAYSLAKLGKLGISVRTAVLLAPAISNGDRNAIGMDRGCLSLIVVVGENDYVLKYVYPIVTDECAVVDMDAFFSQPDFRSKKCEYSKLVVPDQFVHSKTMLFPSHDSSVYIEFLSRAKADAKVSHKIEVSGSNKSASELCFDPKFGLGPKMVTWKVKMITWKFKQFNEWRNRK